MKTILLTCMLFTSILLTAQTTFDITGHFEREKFSREPYGFFGEDQKHYYVLEATSLKALSMGGRVFTIRKLDKATLKPVKEAKYENISFQVRQATYKYLDIVFADGEIKVLVIEAKTADFLWLTIDPQTLKISPNKKKIFSLSKDYKASTLFSRIDLGLLDLDVAWSSESGDDGVFYYAAIEIKDKKEPGERITILFDEDYNELYHKAENFPDRIPYYRDKLLSDGRVLRKKIVWESMEEEGLEPGYFLTFIDKSGRTESETEVFINSGSGEKKCFEYMNLMLSDNTIRLVSYNEDNSGCLIGSMPFDKPEKKLVLEDRPFSMETVAAFKTTNDKKFESAMEKAKKKGSSKLSRHLDMIDVTMSDNNDIFIIGHISIFLSGQEDNTYKYDDLLITKINPDNDIEFSKVVRYKYSSEYEEDWKFMRTSGVVVGDELIILLNVEYKKIKGYQLKENPGDSDMGTIIAMKTDGTSWEKSPYPEIVFGKYDYLSPVFSRAKRESEKSYLVPLMARGLINVGYARIEFN